MGGLYDILESYRDQQNRLNYEGLYEEDADTSINLDPMYNMGARQFGDMRMGMPQATGIMQQAPTQNFEFLSSAYEDENEDDQQVDYLPGQPKSFKDSATLQEYFQNRNPLKGVGGLLGLITGNPIFGLISGGARGLGALNNKMQNSMFGQSKNLAEYFNNRKIAQATGSKDFMNRPRSERNYTGPSGGNNTGGDRGAKGAADSFSNKSGMGRTGY